MGSPTGATALVASGAVVVPGGITMGAVWTLRTGRPFTASAGVDLDGNRNNDYVPGTKKGDGNRMDMDEFLGLVNAFRATRSLAPIPESQIDSDKYNRMDVRVSKAFQLGAAAARGDRPGVQPVRHRSISAASA